MSRADEIFDQNIRDILNSGYSTENDKVRPKWEDGTPAYTFKTLRALWTNCCGYGRRNPIM